MLYTLTLMSQLLRIYTITLPLYSNNNYANLLGLLEFLSTDQVLFFSLTCTIRGWRQCAI